LSYNKFPKEDWDVSEFSEHDATLANGQTSAMRLAERGTRLSNDLWVREVRKLSDKGHQTSIMSTNYMIDLIALAVHMFARWSQENFFKYAREHYNLDQLAGYATQEITDPIQVVNPVYRKLDGEVRSANAKLSRALAVFGASSIEQMIEPAQMQTFTQKKAALSEDIEGLQAQVLTLKAKRKSTPRHIALKDLPEDQRFRQLSTHSKHFVDAIKMIAYRAETAMANGLRQSLTRPDEARTLLCAIYKTEADLIPHYQNKTLTVRLHHLAQQRSDDAVALLCAQLNETETVFPRPDLRMIFELGSAKAPVKVSAAGNLGTSQNPRDQVV
jgi:hypothetical protein